MISIDGPYPKTACWRTKSELCSLFVLMEAHMFRSVVEEAAALASITLFLGMIAVWAQVLGML
jgi:hypothetical protein